MLMMRSKRSSVLECLCRADSTYSSTPRHVHIQHVVLRISSRKICSKLVDPERAECGDCQLSIAPAWPLDSLRQIAIREVTFHRK